MSQKYAALRHKGANYKIMDLYENLHMWIEDNKYERLKNKWHSEIFNSREDSEDLDVELLDTIE